MSKQTKDGPGQPMQLPSTAPVAGPKVVGEAIEMVMCLCVPGYFLLAASVEAHRKSKKEGGDHEF